MKAFILAAGNGTRLRPLTDSVPKCLLPIQGVPLLAIWLENCRSAGITDVLVNAHLHANQVRAFVRQANLPPRVQVVEEKNLLGSAGTLDENRSFVHQEDAFFVLYGDVLTNVSLGGLMEFHRSRKKLATLGICQVADPSRCGIVTTDDDGTVRSFVEKPARPETNWAFAGVMIASPRVLDFVPSDRPADIGFHLLPLLIGHMSACVIGDYLLDIGTLENYRAAESSWPGLRKG
ncbi:MAG TPA: nucleotidyltransferase family protein [Terriglobales bacterium]